MKSLPFSLAVLVLALAAPLFANEAELPVPVTAEDGSVTLAYLNSADLDSGAVSVEAKTGRERKPARTLQVAPAPILLVASDGAFKLFDLLTFVQAILFDDELVVIARPIGVEPRTGASQTSSGGSRSRETSLKDLARGKAKARASSKRDSRKVSRKDRKPKRSGKRSRDKDSGELPSKTFTVKATVEGLIGGRTATGHIIKKYDVAVALPSRSVLNKKVAVQLLKNKRISKGWVFDVGPWNIDDPYWTSNRRPQAESGVDRMGRRTNGAGIDLSDGMWYKLLKLKSFDVGFIERQSGKVKWGFVKG